MILRWLSYIRLAVCFFFCGRTFGELLAEIEDDAEFTEELKLNRISEFFKPA